MKFWGGSRKLWQWSPTFYLCVILDLMTECADNSNLKTHIYPPGSLLGNRGNPGKIFLVRITIPSKQRFLCTTFYITLM